MATPFKMRKFDMSSIPYGSICVMLGKRNTGKSVLVKDLLYYKQDIPVGCAISGSECANGFYGEIIPDMFIHDQYYPEILLSYKKRQEDVKRFCTLNNINDTPGNIDINYDPRAFLILDDCLYDKKAMTDEVIRWVFMNGRHYNILFLLTMQYPLGITPNLRTNIDYTFILRDNLMRNRKVIYENYASMFETFDMFNQIMDQCTADYECLVIHNGASSNDLADQVFWYKADLHCPFQVGSPICWRYNAELKNAQDEFNNSMNNNNNGYNQNTYRNSRRGNKPICIVEKY